MAWNLFGAKPLPEPFAILLIKYDLTHSGWNKVVKGLINNKSSLVQLMACHQTGDNPLSEPMTTQFMCVARFQCTQFTDTYMRHQVSMYQ